MPIISEGSYFIKEIFEKREQIATLTKRDFQDRYTGSFLGVLWAFIQPLAMMLIMWGVFTLGLKVQPSGSVPFVAYLFTGMIAYNFFADTVSANAGVIQAYSFLVKKVKFRVAILPMVKINSGLLLHGVFLLIVMPILWASGVTPSLYWFQVLYYLAALLVLILGLSWLLAAIGVFIRDIVHVIGVLTTFGFWLTPIFWNLEMVPEPYRPYLKVNPLYYIVQGYRDSFIHHIPFWSYPLYTLYYWGVTAIIFLLGITVFKKLRPHFADVI